MDRISVTTIPGMHKTNLSLFCCVNRWLKTKFLRFDFCCCCNSRKKTRQNLALILIFWSVGSFHKLRKHIFGIFWPLTYYYVNILCPKTSLLVTTYPTPCVYLICVSSPSMFDFNYCPLNEVTMSRIISICSLLREKILVT